MADVKDSSKEDIENTEEHDKKAEVNGEILKSEEKIISKDNIKLESKDELKNQTSEENPTPKDSVVIKSEPKVEMDPKTRMKKIKRQIEYYFGDFNLPTDKFLREEVKKKEGWIPLDTLLKFKRLALLTTDPAVIVEALDGSDLIQFSDDKTEVRRNPDKPLPEENEARRKEVMSRTLYVKGFPTEGFTIDTALDYFEELCPTDDIVLRFWNDKATRTWKFKGSIFVKFPSREAAAEFLAREEVKFGDQVLIKMWQIEYVENKRKERLEQRMLKRKRPEQEDEEKQEEEDKGLPKNATLHMTKFPEGLMREAVKERLEEMGVVVAFIDYQKGDLEGWIRLYEAGSAANVMEQCEGGVLKLKDGQEVTLRPLEGDEEVQFLESAKNSIMARRNKGGRQQRGRRGGGRGGSRGGGRGGRGGGNWRKRRHDTSDGPQNKAMKLDGSDEDE